VKERGSLNLFAVLICLGLGWGLTIPLGKVAVSEGYRHFGLIFWQQVIGIVLLGAVTLARRRRLPLGMAQLRLYLVVAVIGTVLPNSASFTAAIHLPAGVISIIMSLIPMLAFPIALALGNERFAWRRLAGLLLGLLGVLILVVPGASLPNRAMVAFVPLSLAAAALYALEGNVVARWGTQGADAVQVLLGASLIGAVLVLPLALATGQFIDPRPPWGLPDLALVASSCVHAAVYATYVWLVGRAGSVFAAQVSYIVTAAGVGWAMALLGERYPGGVWIAMAVLLCGVFLVQPRPKGGLVAAPRDARL